MPTKKGHLFLTLLLMISFGSVNAVLFTPSLPDITRYFLISDNQSQQTMIWYLVGYALSQLIYGPISNRFGRKKALYAGIGLQIMGSLVCVFSGYLYEFNVLIVSRFFMGIGAGVGLKMAFTLVNEYYEASALSQKVAYLMLAFAIAPGISVACGGILNQTFGWESCFYAGALYGLLLIFFVTRITETKIEKQLNALQLKNLLRGYRDQFSNVTLILSALLMGGASSLIYVFSSAAPFIGMNLLGMNCANYGALMILPSIGLAVGSLFTAKYSEKHGVKSSIILGAFIVVLSSIMMLFAVLMNLLPLFVLFLPMMLGYFGLSLIFPNASVLAMHQVLDKANGSAVMNFISMGTVVFSVLSIQSIQMNIVQLLMVNVIIELLMFGIIFRLSRYKGGLPISVCEEG